MLKYDTREEIFNAGHRAFVGGTDDFFWNRIGELQFQFLIEKGLEPHHCVFDIACGSLRGGSKLIEYLDADCYVGFDKYIELIILGVMHEVGPEIYAKKQPRFSVGASFDFRKVEKIPDYALAQSLFTHLTEEDIGICLRNLRIVAQRPLRFFATFFEKSEIGIVNPTKSHSHDVFYYTRGEMEKMARQFGYEPIYHGPWNHPRNQMMFEFRID